jgi:hypothetical protein
MRKMAFAALVAVLAVGSTNAADDDFGSVLRDVRL